MNGGFEGIPVELAGIAPEISLSVAALVLLVVHAIVGDKADQVYVPLIAVAGLGLSIYFAIDAWDVGELQLAGMVAVDGYAAFCKVTLAVFGILTVALGRDHLRRESLEESEFYALVLFAVTGMMLMVGAADLIMMFVALETFSIAIYVLVGYRVRSVASQESAMKYFLLGSFSSAFFLLGIALAYGAVGSTNLYSSDASSGMVAYLTNQPVGNLSLLIASTALLIVGLGFKVAAVPFHAWTPDAYQGAPSPVTGFMAAATKLAAFAAMIRLVAVVLYPLRWDWRPVLIGIALVTMVVGSVFAVVQEDVKRILAYSSIAHAGFVLTGVIAANDGGVAGALFYLATYGLTVLGAFAVVGVVGGRDERLVRLVDYRGLFFESPALAGALTLFLLSLAGVPITSGFVGKLLVFGAAVEAGYAWVAVAGVLTSAIAAFFYLRIMVVMYMEEPEGLRTPQRAGLLPRIVIGLAALATVVFGLLWTPLIEAAEKATVFFAGP